MVLVGTGSGALLSIDVPIVLAPFGPWDQVELAAAVCEAGALGNVGTAVRSVTELREQWHRLRGLTDRPFAINHTGRPFNEAAFEATLEFGPAAISFHMGLSAVLIADGRGVAAALALGAAGVSLGPRFLASTEMTVDTAWKHRIVTASALDAVKVPHAERVMPPFTLPQTGVPFAPRALRTGRHRPFSGELIGSRPLDRDSVPSGRVRSVAAAVGRAGTIVATLHSTGRT